MKKAQIANMSSSKKLLIYDYEEAWQRLIEQIFDGFHMRDPLMRLLPPRRSPHAGPHRYTQGDQTLDQHSELVTYETSGHADLREGDINGHTDFISKFAQARVQKMASQVFDGVGELAEFIGHSVEAGGKPFNIDIFLEAIETIWLRFIGEEDLQVNFIAHPQAKPSNCLFVALPGVLMGFMHRNTIEKVMQAPWTEEQQRRYDQIIARKRAEQHAAKRTRRLS